MNFAEGNLLYDGASEYFILKSAESITYVIMVLVAAQPP